MSDSELYLFLAEGISIIHTLFVISLIVWPVMLIIFRRKWILACWGTFTIGVMASQLWFLGCPLTKMENSLREAAGSATLNSDGFIVHYLQQWFSISFPAQAVNTATVLFGILTAFFILIYFLLGYIEKKVGKSIPQILKYTP